MKNIKLPNIRIRICNTFSKRFVGLMFRRHPLEAEGIWIVPCSAIHMLFVYFPIDVIFLNKDKEVVRLKMNAKPWKTTLFACNAYSTLEVPAGTIAKLGVKIGDKIEL